MSRRYVLIAATSLLVACPAPTAKPPGSANAAAAIRLRVARAEARRAGGVNELADLATHGAKQERLLALRGLGRIGMTGSTGAPGNAKPIAILVAALGDPDPDVVGAAAGAIGVAASLDDGDLGVTDALLAALPRGKGPVLEALGRAGTQAAQPALAQVLADPKSDPALAEIAGLALARHGRRKIELGAAPHAALVPATRSADPRVRYAAVYALAREYQPPSQPSPHPAAEAALAGRLGDPIPEIRAQAIAGLGRRKAVASARSAGAHPGELLLDRDWRVAVEAVHALGETDDGKDAIAAAIVKRFDQLSRGDAAAAHVILEGEKALAGAASRPTVAAALASLGSLATGASAAVIPALTRGWIECLATSATVRAMPAPDFGAIEKCTLPDHLRLPLVAELISANIGSLAARRAALAKLLSHRDPRVRATGMGALGALWTAGDATDQRNAIATLTTALAAPDLFVAGAAVDAAAKIYEASNTGDRSSPALPAPPASPAAPTSSASRVSPASPASRVSPASPASRLSLAALDAALIARATTERDPELGSSLLALIGKRTLSAGADACRAALHGDPVRAKAAADCLKALGEAPPSLVPITMNPPPVDVSAVIGKVLRWRVATSRGDVVIRLHPDVAPWAVAMIVALTRKQFYDGIAFHRVVPNFVVQGGDPTESGSGGPGFSIPAEPATLADGIGYQTGGVGIADAGRDSGGSQWFVMHSRAPHLDGRYTWIGTVESGQKYVDALLIGDRVIRATIESPAK
jgi:cyclophilin family peptidyl-prolyl cis-trans isomerase